MDAIVQLGTRMQAERLFSYPNIGHETESLDDTIKHYIGDKPDDTLQASTNKWAGRDDELLALVKKQAGLPDTHLAEIKAALLESVMPSPTQLMALEEKFYREAKWPSAHGSDAGGSEISGSWKSNDVAPIVHPETS